MQKVYQVCYRKGADKIVKLAQVRKAKGMTQAQLSAVSGVHRVTIARYECGMCSPNLATIERLADALGVPIDEIVDKKAG